MLEARGKGRGTVGPRFQAKGWPVVQQHTGDGALFSECTVDGASSPPRNSA